MDAYGCGVDPLTKKRELWLAERPERYGGTWALGCIWCRDAMIRLKTGSGTADAEFGVATERNAQQAAGAIAPAQAQMHGGGTERKRAPRMYGSMAKFTSCPR